MEPVTLLIVDDEVSILNIFRLILEASGYRVDTASTAEEGIRLVTPGKYQICLLDLNLPDMHGTELVRVIHEMDPGMKKLMITGEYTGQDMELAKKNGADGFIQKPVNKAGLLEAIRNALKEE